MTTVPIIATVLNISISALTPIERWGAAGSRFSGSFFSGRWFIVATVVTIIILIALLVIVSLHQIKQQRTHSNRLFDEYSKKSGLSEQESKILMDIANKAGLKQSEAIFTTAGAFDRGAGIIVEESLNEQQETDKSEQLKTELVHLREKLGFQKQAPTSIGIATKARKLSSRQIPVGKNLHITRRKTRNLSTMESTVIKNDDLELTVKLAKTLESLPGESWRARYYFGASVWEFDTTAVSCNGDILVLNHNDDVRFINRRRFLRVPVNRSAFVATFPFSKEVVIEDDDSKDNSSSKQTLDEVFRSHWALPEFVPVVVTELAGPGLRMDIPLEVKVGDRVLVAFKLDEEKGQNATSLHQDSKQTMFKIVEDIGEVRHSKATETGFSIAVELTGLSDSDVNELICATNAASLKANGSDQKSPDSAGDRQSTKEDALETAAV